MVLANTINSEDFGLTVKQQLTDLLKYPEQIAFDQVMALVNQCYQFTPTRFRNGNVDNAAGENNGSCKVFSLAQLHDLSADDTLALFGEHYRSVLASPRGDDHQNIRNFQAQGWAGISFSGDPLTVR